MKRPSQMSDWPFALVTGISIAAAALIFLGATALDMLQKFGVW